MNSDYAIIATGGKQYRVREGDTIDVEKLAGEIGELVQFDRVLLTSVGGQVSLGKPSLEGARVVGEIANQFRGPKITVFKYKPKTRRRVKKGHRQQLTSVRIRNIAVQEPATADQHATE